VTNFLNVSTTFPEISSLFIGKSYSFFILIFVISLLLLYFLFIVVSEDKSTSYVGYKQTLATFIADIYTEYHIILIIMMMIIIIIIIIIIKHLRSNNPLKAKACQLTALSIDRGE
jgi:hypothetical protein